MCTSHYRKFIYKHIMYLCFHPHVKYKIFASLLQHVRDTQLHKKCIWLTNGLLTSINEKDHLYKILMQRDTTIVELFDILKEEFKVYRARLRRGIKEAKRIYYRITFHIIKKLCFTNLGTNQ